MGDGQKLLQRLVVVHQHIGVGVVGAPGVRAGGLALVLIGVDPAFAERPLEDFLIVRAQRSECLHDERVGLFKGQVDGKLAGHPGVHVVHGGVIKAQPLHLEAHHVVKRRQVAVDGLDQAVIHGGGHVVAVERGLQRALEFRGARREQVRLDRRGVDRGHGGGVAPEGLVHCGEGGLAHFPVRAHHVVDVAAVGQRGHVALAVGHFGKLHVGVGQHVEDGVGGGSQFARHGHDALFRGGQRVGPRALDGGKEHAVVGERRIRCAFLQVFRRQRDQFRRQEGSDR